MKIDLDPEKDEINRFKHRVSLAFGRLVFADPAHDVITTFRDIDREKRFKAVGMVEGKLYTVVFVPREGAIRIISVRRSNHGEQKEYGRNPR